MADIAQTRVLTMAHTDTKTVFNIYSPLCLPVLDPKGPLSLRFHARIFSSLKIASEKATILSLCAALA
jgi:hypothetical protein